MNKDKDRYCTIAFVANNGKLMVLDILTEDLARSFVTELWDRPYIVGNKQKLISESDEEEEDEDEYED